jgi:predicted ATPase
VSGYNIFSDENKTGIFIVQEPEIHLHPNAQAAMGSFFVELSQGSGQIFVETHSDNLILRVARHVALGHLSPNDVQIIHVSDVENHKVTEIGIDKFGSFTKKFPEDFFPQRKKESFNLARAGMLAEEEDSFVKKSFEYPEFN